MLSFALLLPAVVPPPPPSAPWHLAPAQDVVCDYGEVASQAECESAVAGLADLFGLVPSRSLQVGSGGSCNGGSWGNVPLGCSAQAGGDWAAHYKTSGTNCNSGVYRLVCSTAQAQATTMWHECQLRILTTFGDSKVQLSELVIRDQSGSRITGGSASTTCSNYPSNEAPAMGIDGSTGTKFLCHSYPTDLVMTFSSFASVASYDIITANDVPGRDPHSWTFACRTASDTAWRELSRVENMVQVTARFTSYGGFNAANHSFPPSTVFHKPPPVAPK